MLILGLDFETSGLDPEKDRVLEVGLALWDVDAHRAVRQADRFVVPDVVIPDKTWDELLPVHGIRRELVEKYGVPSHFALAETYEWMLASDAVVAHNGTEFDQHFYEAWCRRFGKKPHGLWVDTRLDLPEALTGPLITQAAKRGFLNPFPHQALSDVMTMLKILDGYDIPKIVERAKTPNVYVEALVPFERKDEAKEAGYFWNGYPSPTKKLRTTKQWLKKIKECDAEREALEVPFKIRPVRDSSLLP